MNLNDPSPPPNFPKLQIITVDPPRLTQREKYGGLFYLGIVGLIVVVSLVGWFSWNAWMLRDVWSNVYILHDRARSEDERIHAASALSRDNQVNAQQRWDIALRKPLPALARYIMAESWSTEILKEDPALFAKIVANSEGWPPWLRLLGVRLMAVAACEGVIFPPDVLNAIEARPEADFKPWVDFIRAVSPESDVDAAARLRTQATLNSPGAGLAKELVEALEDSPPGRTHRLATATLWLRMNDPAVAPIWNGWTERDGQIVRSRP